jgi:biopolymer transport protein TolR
MAQQIENQDEALSEVNVIPLADLSLVLLIILMVMSPMVSQALIQVTKAQATAANVKEELPDEKPETPVIVSFEPGKLKINGIEMNSDLEFVTRLEQIMTPRRDKSVNLTASPLLTHGKVVHLMDLCRRHGGEKLVMLKWAGEGAAPAGPAS